MSRAFEVIARIEKLGGGLALDEGGAIRYRLPKRRAHALLAQLRQEKPALEAYLKAMAAAVVRKEQAGSWDDPGSRQRPDASQSRYGQHDAALLAFIGMKVWTPKGVGKLISVSSTGCEILVERTFKTIRVSSGEVSIIQ